MNPAGLLLVIAGTWVLTQVFGGNALGRLGVSGKKDAITGPVSGLDGGGKSGAGGGGGGGGSW